MIPRGTLWGVPALVTDTCDIVDRDTCADREEEAVRNVAVNFEGKECVKKGRGVKIRRAFGGIMCYLDDTE